MIIDHDQYRNVSFQVIWRGRGVWQYFNSIFWFKANANALKKGKYWIELLPNTPSPLYYGTLWH